MGRAMKARARFDLLARVMAWGSERVVVTRQGLGWGWSYG